MTFALTLGTGPLTDSEIWLSPGQSLEWMQVSNTQPKCFRPSGLTTLGALNVGR